MRIRCPLCDSFDVEMGCFSVFVPSVEYDYLKTHIVTKHTLAEVMDFVVKMCIVPDAAFRYKGRSDFE